MYQDKAAQSYILLLRAVDCSRWFCSRVFFLYLILGVLFWGITDKRRITRKALNQSMPAVAELVKLLESENPPDLANLKKVTRYYEKAAKSLPRNSAAQGMAGYCYYYLGKDDKAIAFYKKAIEINPHFFWFYYNQGVIYFLKGHYDLAVPALQKALLVKPSESLAFVLASKLYGPYLWHLAVSRNSHDAGVVLLGSLMQGRRVSYELLVLSHFYQKQFLDAYRYAKEAVNLSLDSSTFFYYYAGLAAYNLKLFNEAVGLLEECLKKDINHADANYYMGLSLRALGRENLAQDFIKRAESLKASGVSYSPDLSDVRPRIF